MNGDEDGVAWQIWLDWFYVLRAEYVAEFGPWPNVELLEG